MKTLTLSLLLLSIALIARAQAPKRKVVHKVKIYGTNCRCYLPKDPHETNPYLMFDTVKKSENKKVNTTT